jgi:biotin-(acetyl-CoA carboxylase) ligase
VETRPAVAPTPFVPSVTSLREHAAGGAELLPRFVALLLESLDTHYETLLRDGYRSLLDHYRERSVVVGCDVAICAEGSDRWRRCGAEVGCGRWARGWSCTWRGGRNPSPAVV